MIRRVAIGGLALAMAALAAVPVQAEPVDKPLLSSTGRFARLDTAQLGKIVNLPQWTRKDKVVSALVQLSGDPVAVQRLKVGARGFRQRAAEQRVEARQDAILPELKAAGAQTYGRLTTVLNAVQVRVAVRDLAKLAAVPGVRTVEVSSAVHRDNAAAERFTGVDRTWQDLGLTGKGQVIGIIDSGIDYTHAGFGGPGTPEAYQNDDSTIIEPGTFPTAKVTGGFDFVGDRYNPNAPLPADRVPRPDEDPLDCDGHGSHVAGTAAGSGVTADGDTYAGPYNRVTLNQAFSVEPGVAPEATLRAYRVFGCSGPTGTDIVVAAIDRAVADGVDVINMSLGSPFGTARNLYKVAVQTATETGVLVVTSAGNEGPNAYIIGEPSTSDVALSVAAIDAEFPTFPGVSFAGAVTGEGLNANDAAIPVPITGQVVDVGLGCAASDYATASGKIALTTRGNCDRVERAKLGQQAGALAVIMINNVAGIPPFEGPIDGVTIPFIGVDGDRAAAFKATNGQSVTIAESPDVANPAYTLPAAFSSNGPRRLDSAQKPDVGAPGVSIPSVGVGTGTGAARISGTSMASPHTAGVAALVRQVRGTWSPRQVKSVIMSTAAPEKIRGFDSRRVGTGLVQPRRATVSKTYAWTGSGLNSLKFGMNQLGGSYSEAHSFKITNTATRSTVTYDLSTQFSSQRFGADVTISPRAVTLRPGQTRKIWVTIKMSRDDVAQLPGAIASDGGKLVSLNGLVVAKPRIARSAFQPLKISFLLVPVPLSNITASASVQPVSDSSYSPIQVQNSGVHTGTADVYSWLLADPAGDAFDPEVADLTNLGVQSLPGEAVGADPSDRLLVFAASQATSTSNHATREVDVVYDVNGDDQFDFGTFATDTGFVLTGVPDGTVTAFTVNLATNAVVDAWTGTAPANGSTVLLPVLASSLGLTSASNPVTVRTAGFTLVGSTDSDQVAEAATFDPFSPALSQGDLVAVRPGETKSIPVSVDPEQLANQTHMGWLVVSLDDRSGLREADRVKLELAPAAAAALAAQVRKR